MKRRNVNKQKNYITIIPLFIVICVALLSIGWSAFQSTFNISNLYATVRVDKDIRVTNVYARSSTNQGRSNYEEYNVSSIYSSIYLPSQNSTVTYRVQVTNVGNVMQGIYDIEEIYKIIGTNTNSNLEIKSKTITLKEALCSNQNSSLCENGTITTFDIEIGYKTNGYDGSHQTHFVTLNFDFRRVFGITYNGFGNTSGLSNTMIDGDTKVITFNSTTGIPANTTTTGATGNYNSTTHQLTLSNVTLTGLNDVIAVARHYGITYSGFTGSSVSSLPDSIIYTGETIQIPNGVDYPDSIAMTGATGSYNDQTHVITISSISSDITITATYNNSGPQVVVNPDGTTTTTTTTTNPNGSTTVSAVTTDQNGDTVSETTTTTNTDNSSTTTTTNYSSSGTTTTTTNYDTNGDPTTGSTATTDTSGNVNTQNVTYDNNNNPVVTGYTIDTTGNSNGGETLNNSSLDTGMIVFDGKGFEMTLTFKAKLTENAGNHIFGIIQKGTSNNKYSGFVFTVKQAKTNANAQLNLSAGTNSSYNSNSGAIGSFIHRNSKYWGVATSNSKVVTQYSVTLTYLPANYGTNQTSSPSLTMTFSPITTGSYCNTSPMTSSDFLLNYVPTSLSNATFTLGGSGIISASSMVNFEVISFNVHKI